MRLTPKVHEDAGWRDRGGLPLLICPECGKDGRHWVPDSLKGPGYFTCADTQAAESQEDALFDLEQTDE
jgi:hypothetical protein